MKKLSLILALFLILGLAAGCSGAGEVAYVQSVSMLAGLGPVGAVTRFGGIVAPQSTANVEKSGELAIAELRVKVGDEVKDGDVLFVYDAEQSRLSLEKAKTELEQLRLSLSNREKDLETLQKEKEKASKDQKLSYTLEIQEAETDILELKYNVGEKEKEIERLEESMENLEVVSPVTGRIQSLNENGGTDGMGNPLPFISIVETGRMQVKGTLNEQNAAYLQEGTPVLIRSRVDDATWRGVILRIDWENPSSSDQNGGYVVWEKGAVSTAPDESGAASRYPFYVELETDEGLLMGQHVYIEPDFGSEGEEQAIVLDAGFFSDAESAPWVWAENAAGKLEKRPVTLGAYDEARDAYPVLAGLGAEDNIAFPEERLREGMKCAAYEEAEIDTGAEIDGGEWEIPEDGKYYGEDDLIETGAVFEGAVVGEEEGPAFENAGAIGGGKG
ncbi:MAG: biotin/lipoyl-binding protein [Clostridia bacterium]|nr:biotin/lipoyl-binding protein [Clostridia bacterium]